jgi:hypothetical protein
MIKLTTKSSRSKSIAKIGVKIKRDQDNEEKSIFEVFLLANPQFAGGRIRSWKLAAPDDPPDVICATESGKTVGVEIAQWAHEREMAAGKAREAVEQKIKRCNRESAPK